MFSALTLVVALSSPVIAPGVYHYAASLNGQPAGTSTLTVTRDGETTQIAEASTASIAGLALSATATYVLAGDLTPSRYDGKYASGGQNVATASATLSPDSAAVTTSGLESASRTIALTGGAKYFVVIEPGLLAGLFALPAQMQSWSGATVVAVEPVYARGETIAPDASQKPSPPAGVPASDAEMAFNARIPFTIWYDPGTFVPDAIAVPSQNAVVTRVPG